MCSTIFNNIQHIPYVSTIFNRRILREPIDGFGQQVRATRLERSGYRDGVTEQPNALSKNQKDMTKTYKDNEAIVLKGYPVQSAVA